jgi:hypothetical protein
MNTTKPDYEKQCADNWQILISEFNMLWKTNAAKAEFTKLKEKAKTITPLTYRQCDSILERCDNVMKNEYGNTKRDEHFDHSKPSAKK